MRRRCCAFRNSPKQARAAVIWALPIDLRGGKDGRAQRSPCCHQPHGRCIRIPGKVHMAPQQPGHEQHLMPEDPVLQALSTRVIIVWSGITPQTLRNTVTG